MGKLYVVGLGPGDKGTITVTAMEILIKCQVIVGYGPYVQLARAMLPAEIESEKEYLSTGMGSEIERCQRALDLAMRGQLVALVCSGDAGVYGMASPVIELAADWPDVEIEIVPGVTAALSGAALLGAPLGHDFCVISLSDLLTPWDLIEQRLRLAAQADLAICLYNPASKGRPRHLRLAVDILLEVLEPDRVCGLTRSIGREDQSVVICSLKDLPDQGADMFTTVFIGSSQSQRLGSKLMTPRGYGRPGMVDKKI